MFRDRKESGQLLAKRLGRYAGSENAIVLGLPRGGVVTAFEVAMALDLPLDLLVVRKLGAPGYPELAMGAVTRGGVRVLNEDVIRQLHVSSAEIDAIAEREELEVARRELLFRDNRPPLDIRGRTAIVVDDGLATGSTMFAAVRLLQSCSPARIVIAIPVAPAETVERLRREAQELVCLMMPPSFNAVGEWYADFAQVCDDDVIELLRAASTRQAALAG